MGLGDAWVFGSALTDDASELDHPFIMNLDPSLGATPYCPDAVTGWNELTATESSCGTPPCPTYTTTAATNLVVQTNTTAATPAFAIPLGDSVSTQCAATSAPTGSTSFLGCSRSAIGASFIDFEPGSAEFVVCGACSTPSSGRPPPST